MRDPLNGRLHQMHLSARSGVVANAGACLVDEIDDISILRTCILINRDVSICENLRAKVVNSSRAGELRCLSST